VVRKSTGIIDFANMALFLECSFLFFLDSFSASVTEFSGLTTLEYHISSMVASHDTAINEKSLDASIILRLTKIYIYILIATIF
jgi:hypothetical protein